MLAHGLTPHDGGGGAEVIGPVEADDVTDPAALLEDAAALDVQDTAGCCATQSQVSDSRPTKSVSPLQAENIVKNSASLILSRNGHRQSKSVGPQLNILAPSPMPGSAHAGIKAATDWHWNPQAGVSPATATAKRPATAMEYFILTIDNVSGVK